MPNSLSELSCSAEQHFGHPGTLKMYHKGVTPMTRDQQLLRVKHNDVMVCTWDDKPITQRDLTQMITTHQADFVAKQTEAPARRSRAVKEPYVPHKLTETSSYKQDFLNHGFTPREEMPLSASAPLPSQSEPLGRSSYADAFPWHKNERKQPKPREVAQPWRPAPFEGNSSYKNQYSWPEQQRAAPMDAPPPPEPTPFEGSSTYQDHYPVKPLPKAPAGRREPVPYKPHSLGNYATEYKSLFVHSPRDPTLIHLEPEKGKLPSRASSPSP